MTHRSRAATRLLGGAALTMVTVLGTAGVGAAGTAGTAGTTARTTSAAASPMSALAASSTDLTLLSGERVRLNRSAGGPTQARYTATQLTYPGAGVPLRFRSLHRPGGATTVEALPAADVGLIAGGTVDPHLFELTYLAAHADTTSVPVVLTYRGTRPAAAVAQDAAALPGATYVAGSATGNRATVSVDTAEVGAFWAAVTRTTPFDPSTRAGMVWKHSQSPPRELVPGLASLTLAGAPAVATPAPTPATYRLTVNIVGFSDRSRWAYSDVALSLFLAGVSGVTGPKAGQLTQPTTATCDAVRPCDTITLTFDVPAGVYQLSTSWFATHNSRFAEVTAYRPQVELTHDVTLTLRSDDASYTTLATPRASEPQTMSSSAVRGLPDGSQYTDAYGLGIVNSDYDVGTWLLSSTAPVTVGSFHYAVNEITEQPLVSMAVHTPGRSGVTLTPQYQRGDGSVDQLPGVNGGYTMHRFPAGTHRYTVLDAGFGTAADFHGQDFAGKLAIVRPPREDPGICRANADQLDAALAAHAAGVIYDPTNPLVDNHNCLVPLVAQWRYEPGAATPKLPFVTVQPQQAADLERLVHAGPTSVDLSSVDNPTYLYVATHAWESTIPASIGLSATPANLTTQAMRLRAPDGGENSVSIDYTGWRGFDNFAVGTNFGLFPPGAAPITVTRNVVRPEPDTVVWQSMSVNGSDQSYASDSFAADREPATSAITYGSRPIGYGPPTGQRLYASQVNDVARSGCSLCRQGDGLYPYLDVTSGADPAGTDGDTTVGLDTMTATVNGTSVDLDPNTAAFPVPSTPSKVTVTGTSATRSITWAFTSTRPKTRNLPPTAVCIGTLLGNPATCGADPVVFTRFRTDLDDHNRQAPGRHSLQVEAYHQATSAPSITAVTTSVSFDGGGTWVKAAVTKVRDGVYAAAYTVPAAERTNGYVAIRTTARDAGGNSVSQTFRNAFEVR